MLRALLSRQIDAFERRWTYDASYLREVLAVSPWALLKFFVVGSLGHGRRAPSEAVAAAGIVGALTEDCGPCTQLGIDMARRGGVAGDVLPAILAGDEASMGETAALSRRFARAVLARDMEGADPLRGEIERRWGRGALVDIALALTTARMYPTLKYALGHGKACARLTVEGEAARIERPAALAA
ncbi:MAG: hypothetical protein ACR2FH_06320 [Caulobacteraceae bacterium]